jgi:carbon monoxide dehydrogenase subunit G
VTNIETRRSARNRARGRLVVLAAISALSSACATAVAPARPAASAPATLHPSAVDAADSIPEGWIGGTREVVVAAPLDVVAAALEDGETYRSVLPRVRSLRTLGHDPEGDLLVEVDQGTALFHGGYTARVRRARFDLVTFELDPSKPHDVADAAGYFHLQPAGKNETKVTFHVRIDLGKGPFRFLFANKIERATMSTPYRLKQHLETMSRDGAPAWGTR